MWDKEKIPSSHKESNLKPWDKCKALIFLHLIIYKFKTYNLSYSI